MLIIDACHWYYPAKLDLQRFLPLLRNGVLFFHDINRYRAAAPSKEDATDRGRQIYDFYMKSDGKCCGQLWDEIQHPGKVEIRHSWQEGIGLMFVNEPTALPGV